MHDDFVVGGLYFMGGALEYTAARFCVPVFRRCPSTPARRKSLYIPVTTHQLSPVVELD